MTIQFEITKRGYEGLKKRLTLGVTSEMDKFVLRGRVIDQDPKVGHWINNDELIYCFQCSNCGDIEYMNSNYCPTCGAKMEGGGECLRS